MLELLSRCGGPAGLRKASRTKFVEITKQRAPRMGTRLVDQILTALDAQTVVVPGTTTAETVLPRLADSMRDRLRQRGQTAAQVEGMLDAHPLTSMPGIGVRTAARILLEVGDGTSLPTPRPPSRLRRPGPGHPSLRHQHPRRTPTKRRQQTTQARVFLAAFAALADPTSRTCREHRWPGLPGTGGGRAGRDPRTPARTSQSPSSNPSAAHDYAAVITDLRIDTTDAIRIDPDEAIPLT
ncbi:hypothetical protein GCM10023170_097230 [Phytohabitans houttuyneae]|uniref:IS110 family transposase n=1 Tax=Phytohabitans houttuyneae TaxID=1076126 RepID=A0A6V8K5Y1_9ACTN|nr:hypothetical protein Phou_015760 [Phytohabitans houttuyneae]